MNTVTANKSMDGRMAPEEVKRILEAHMLTQGMMPFVLDIKNSSGVRLREEGTGRTLLDFFGFYATSALGMNHPKLLQDEPFRERLMEAALNKITSSDVRTSHMARFVQTFSRIGIPDYLPYAFFISGGALAVENALKAAFDWKVRKNIQNGYRREVGQKVLHFDQSFHGRSGYTLSLTNTADPRKTEYFPKFDWPRVTNPKIIFPLEQNLDDVKASEKLALAQVKRAFREHPDDIACIIIEPIQSEGGDNHFRPEFLRQLKVLSQENDALLIFDEVQTGVGITGDFWAHQGLGVEPDIVAFGKKTQVCGILAGPRLDEVDDHVFQVPSRLNSTWGGNLVDMVRFDRILEVIEEDDLMSHASEMGDHLIDRLDDLADDHPGVTNVRGRGLLCAFDLPDGSYRSTVLDRCLDAGLVMLGCGERSIRFRSPLTITSDEIDEGIDKLDTALSAVK